MLAGAALLALGTIAQAGIIGFGGLLALWAVLGAAWSAAQLPAGRVLRRSAHHEDLPSLFAAQFALSHACWLFAYPVAGWVGAFAGMGLASLLLAGCAGLAFLLAMRLWPVIDEEPLSLKGNWWVCPDNFSEEKNILT